MLPFKLDVNKYNKQHINKLLPGSDALFIAKLHQKQQTPLLVIANDGYMAKRLLKEIRFFNNKLRIAIFSDIEVLAYDRIAPQKDLIAERLSLLWKIVFKQIDIVIVQVNTLQNHLAPKKYLQQRIIRFVIGDKLSPTTLRTKLIETDYSLVEQVYEAGEFAIRGSIIDIMPMGIKKLLRIELFDNEIESLKIIDPQTKQVLSNQQKFELLPSHEYPVDSIALRILVKNFSQAFPAFANSSLVKSLSKGDLPAGINFYLPLFFDETSNLLDYLDNTWQIVYFQSMHSQLTKNWQEISKRFELYKIQYPCLPPSQLFFSTDEIVIRLKQFKSYLIDENNSLNSNILPIPEIRIDNKLINPLIKLTNFIQEFSGKIIIILDSNGRVELTRQFLETNKLNAILISNLDQIVKDGLYLLKGNLVNGFICDNFAFITETNLYQGVLLKALYKKPKGINLSTSSGLNSLSEIKINDYVVHINHGIGKYLGLTTQKVQDIEYEMVELEYQDEAKLFIPIHNLYLISRYSKLENVSIDLAKLGSNLWHKNKAKVEKKIEDIATQLLDLYAQRELQSGTKFNLPDEYNLFASSFGYELTPDQASSIQAIIKDMSNHKPMDRLVCGDVGFGKTEVALRAAFICAMGGKQVAVLTPTTLLTEQHYQTFSNRFASFPIQVAHISRFRTKKQILATLELVKNGKVDILIGTHRLIQNDIQFKALGLVIIDEEHRFGVKQKEKLKQMRPNVDFLTMTATPIPRTLSMALEGIRDFSIIATPPSRRLPVNTVISNDNNQIITEAISREMRRGGQVFFLYNDVSTINQMYDKLASLLPELRMAIAHGQMPEDILEHTIRDFVKQQYNLLLCSTIIETGIDIPNANTIIIYRADKFGLADLYQLRGRVGRSHHQAYCYLITPENISIDAQKRLEAIESTTELGSGFNLAIHDLEIRGAGEILGDNQSGNIREVGFSLYSDMLKKAIKHLRNGSTLAEINDKDLNCEVNLNSTCMIPDNFCHNVNQRLIYYKLLAKATIKEELDLIYQEIIDDWGLAPEPVQSLIAANHLRLRANKLGIKKLEVDRENITLTFIINPPVDPLKIIMVMQQLNTCKYENTKNKLVWSVKLHNIKDKIEQTGFILDKLNS